MPTAESVAVQRPLGEPGPLVGPAASGCKPWEFWASIAWAVLAGEVLRPAVDTALEHLPLSEAVRNGAVWHAVSLIVSWITPLIVLVVAVRLRQCPVRDYFAWVGFRVRPLIIGIIILATLIVAFRALNYFGDGDLGYPIEQTRDAMAHGMSRWWAVMRWYPGFFYAPIVEETVFRGFLWRGMIGTRIGRTGTLLLTSLLFAAVHYRYFIQDGTFNPGAFLSPFIAGILFGWVRLKSGSTIASMIVHSLSNIELNAGAGILA